MLPCLLPRGSYGCWCGILPHLLPLVDVNMVYHHVFYLLKSKPPFLREMLPECTHALIHQWSFKSTASFVLFLFLIIFLSSSFFYDKVAMLHGVLKSIAHHVLIACPNHGSSSCAQVNSSRCAKIPVPAPYQFENCYTVYQKNVVN